MRALKVCLSSRRRVHLSARRARAGLAVLAAAAAVVVSFGTAAKAQSQTPTPVPAKDWSVYARAGVGVAFANRLDQTLLQDPRVAFLTPPPDRRVTDFGVGASPTFALGFAYPSGSRTELEYRYVAPPIDAVRASGGFDPVRGGPFDLDVVPPEKVAAHFLMSNAYYEVARAGRAAAFVGAGVGGGFFTDSFGQRDAAFAYQGRVGASVDLSDTVRLQLEYVYLRTRDLVFGPDRIGRGAIGETQAAGDPFVLSTASLSFAIDF